MSDQSKLRDERAEIEWKTDAQFYWDGYHRKEKELFLRVHNSAFDAGYKARGEALTLELNDSSGFAKARLQLLEADNKKLRAALKKIVGRYTLPWPGIGEKATALWMATQRREYDVAVAEEALKDVTPIKRGTTLCRHATPTDQRCEICALPEAK